MPPQALDEFTVKYHAALEAAFDHFGRGRFPLHGNKVDVIHICIAADGYVTFYLPAPAGLPASAPRGCMMIDYSQYTLNVLCQAMHARYLKVGNPRIGRPAFELPGVPPDEAAPEGFAGHFFSETVLAACVSRAIVGVPLPGMMVTPLMHVEGGIVTGITPSRLKVWSPTVNIPGHGLARLYQWTHADFWWKPEELPLDQENAEALAVNDLLALQTVMGAGGVVPPPSAGQDTSSMAADMLEAACEELEALLTTSADEEEPIHQWLFRPEHHLFIDPQPAEVRSKVQFGDSYSDFVVRRPNNTYVLVEIERPKARLFQEHGQEPTAEFNHACQQVRDWQRYIRDNVQTVRTEQKLDGIDQPGGVVIMGRSADITGEAAQRRWRDMKTTHDMNVATYDDVCARVRALASLLRTMLRGPSAPSIT